MTFEEKQELVNLLRIYSYEQLTKAKSCQSQYVLYGSGYKSQYNHARIIADKLSLELEKEMY